MVVVAPEALHLVLALLMARAGPVPVQAVVPFVNVSVLTAVVDVVAVVTWPWWVSPGAAKVTVPATWQLIVAAAPAVPDAATRVTAPALAGMAIAAATKSNLRIM